MKRFCLFAAVVAASVLFAGPEAETVAAAAPKFTPENLPLTEKMTLLALQIGLILFAAKLGGMLASLFKMPSVLGELGAGILIGPWCLGGIGFGDGLFKFGLFRGGELELMMEATGNAFAVTPELYGICTVASVVLLFLSGVETNLKMFLKFAFAGSMVGIAGVVASFLCGDLCAVYLLPKFMPESFGHLRALADESLVKAIMNPAAMFMGIMSTATSVGITARILSERRKMDSEEGVTIMSGAVIDDVLGIIVLAIGMGIITASGKAAGGDAGGAIDWSAIGMVALKAFGIWLGGTVIGVTLARRISWLLKLFKSPLAIATLAFGLSLVIAGLFEAMGLTLIIGAYVMGLALSRTDLKHLIQENLQAVYTFLVPVFFCVMGMMVDCRALCSKQVLTFGAIYTVLAILSKIVGCALPALFCGFNLKGALRVGAGMIPRGEVALIIASIGVSTMVNGKPILTQEVFGIGILMTLVTTIAAPPCLVALFNLKGVGVNKRNYSNDGSRPFSFTLPNAATAELMVEKLMKAFRQDGFFTYLLSSTDNIWEVTMDDVEISVRQEGEKICFESTPNEEALIMSAWMEVVGEINELAAQIRKPIRQDEFEIMLKNENSEKKANVPSLVSRFVQGFVMLPDFKANSKQEAIDKMIEAIAAQYPQYVTDVEKVKKSVYAREESMPTGLDHGIAVPHGRTDGVNHILGAVALVDNSGNENGIIPDYETIDHSKIQIIVLTLVPDSSQAPYLQLMAFISRILHAGSGYEKLLECKTADDMRKFFRANR